MRNKMSSCAIAALLALPLCLSACGDDDGDPSDASGGRAGSSTGGNTMGGRSGAGGSANTNGGTAGESPMPGEAGSGGMPPTACDLSGEGLERKALAAEIEDDLELTNDVVWTINGTVKVHSGATLTIPPCTRLEGTAEPAGVLAVLPGGRIEAEGTADAPILFTSEALEGERAAGQWGGLVLLGRAPITRANGGTTAIYEGLTDADFTYGGSLPEDDSGVLSHVRIEFGGYEIFPDKEVNGLSMAGVGSGTTIDHVMVSNTLDDCFEWWGGTVEANHLIANNCGDDYFDGDEGWAGGGQFWFGRRNIDSVDSDDPNGLEMDSINDGTEPRTNFAMRDITLCSTGEESQRPGPHFGMVLRELVTGTINNLALVGFEYGIDTRDAFVEDDVVITNSTAWDLLSGLGAPDTTNNDAGFDDETVFTAQPTNDLDPAAPPFTLAECLDPAGPDATVIDSAMGAFPNAAAVANWGLDGSWIDWSTE